MSTTAKPIVGGFADNVWDPWGGGRGRVRSYSDAVWAGYWKTDRAESVEKEERIRKLQSQLESERGEAAKRIRELENAFSVHGPGSGCIILDLPDDQKAVFRNLLTGFGDYVKAKQYELSFAFDETIPQKISFKFGFAEGSPEVSRKQVQEDFSEYIEAVNRGNTAYTT